MLTIKGEKKEEKEEKRKDYFLSERRFGSFERSFRIPQGFDQSKIEATFWVGCREPPVPGVNEYRRKRICRARRLTQINTGQRQSRFPSCVWSKR